MVVEKDCRRRRTRPGAVRLRSAEEQLAADQAQCERYGFVRGTEAFANCLMELDRQRRPTPGVTFGVGVGTRF